MAANHPNIIEISKEELNCSICFEIMDDPAVIPCCRQMFCRRCIEESLKTSICCPHCRTPMTRKSLMSVPRLIDNILHSMGRNVSLSGLRSTRHTAPTDVQAHKHGGSNAASSETRIRLLEETKGSLENEVNRLKRRLNQMSVTSNDSNMRSVIESARNQIHYYVIEKESEGFGRRWRRFCVEMCQNAVLLHNSYTTISERIVQELTDEDDSDSIWHSFVWQQNCGESMVTSDGSEDALLRIRFDKLIIKLFSFGDE